jgi:flagellum-specific peptidoglycan hydrolase FlgJ
MGEDKLCNNQQAVSFVFEHYAEAKQLADKVNVPVENILGLAAEESQYGTGSIAQECKNYFSLHAPAKFQIGSQPARGDPSVKVAKFQSFKDCGESFIASYGERIRNKTDPHEFARALITARFNSGKSADGGRDDFADYLADIIRAVKIRTACKHSTK